MVQGAHRQGDTDPVADGEQRRGGVAGGGGGEKGHGLGHAVRESSERVDQYDRMRTPIPGDLVIELTHRYGPRARIDPNRIGWMIGGDAFRPLVTPLDSPDRSVSFDQGVWIALPIRDETFNPDGRTGADHPDAESAA